LHLSVRTHPKFSTFLNCFGRQARYSIRGQNMDPRNSCFCHTSRTSRVYCRPSAAGLYDSNNNRRGRLENKQASIHISGAGFKPHQIFLPYSYALLRSTATLLMVKTLIRSIPWLFL